MSRQATKRWRGPRARHGPELMFGACSEIVRRSARVTPPDPLPIAFVMACKAKPGTRLELVTPSLPFTVAGRRGLRQKRTFSRHFMLMINEESEPNVPPDIPQYAAIDLVFCHSWHPSGRTSAPNLNGDYLGVQSRRAARAATPWVRPLRHNVRARTLDRQDEDHAPKSPVRVTPPPTVRRSTRPRW